MLLHSSYDFNFVMKQPVNIITRLLKKAYEKSEKDKGWQIWLAKYPHMTKDNFVDFETYWAQSKKPSVKPEYQNETVQDTFNRFKKIAQGGVKND